MKAERCPSWPKEHDWKSCMRQKRIRGSNPRLSARIIQRVRQRGEPVQGLHPERDSNLFSYRRGVRGIEFARTPCGGVAEWLNAAVSKTVLPVIRVTRVRIPPPPPEIGKGPVIGAFFASRGLQGLGSARLRRRSFNGAVSIGPGPWENVYTYAIETESRACRCGPDGERMGR